MADPKPQLLVSVRSVAEAMAAFAGGADLIDVKEPSRGPLGRADGDVLDAIRDAVGRRCPISAALGELSEFAGTSPRGYDFAKLGLASLGGDPEWRPRWSRFRDHAQGTRAVLAAYADWRTVAAPELADVVDFALAQPSPILLVDTARKSKGETLLDHLSLSRLAEIVSTIRGVGGRIALAGSLDDAAIASILKLAPDWIAVRGAACVDGRRDGSIDVDRVRRMKASLEGS